MEAALIKDTIEALATEHCRLVLPWLMVTAALGHPGGLDLE
jgi:hypothetical protein